MVAIQCLHQLPMWYSILNVISQALCCPKVGYSMVNHNVFDDCLFSLMVELCDDVSNDLSLACVQSL